MSCISLASSRHSYRDDQVRLQPQCPLTILNVILTIPTSSNAVEYLVEGDFTNNAAAVAEKALKPESDASFKKEVARIKTIAHWIRVTRQMLEDAPRICSYIDNRLTVKLKQKREDHVVDGDGADENLLDVLRTVGLLARVHGVASNGIGGAIAVLLAAFGLHVHPSVQQAVGAFVSLLIVTFSAHLEHSKLLTPASE